MNADTRKRGLGRGLDALFREVKSEEDSRAQQPEAAPAPEHKIRRGEEIELAVKHAQPAQKPNPAQAPVNTAPQTQAAQKPVETKSAPVPPPATGNQVRMLRVGQLKPGKYQPRVHFEPEEIEGLADSIASFGILTPLLVRPAGQGPAGEKMYEIIGGERRWRAAQKAQVHEVPVVIHDLDDLNALQVSLVDNLQRADINPVEEADGYQRLIEEFGQTQDQISHQLGKSRSHIANSLRLLRLPAFVRVMVREGKLSAGHARALVGIEGAADIAATVVDRQLSVRQTEKLIRESGARAGAKPRKGQASMGKDVDTKALEDKITNLLGLRVTIAGNGVAGTLSIAYKTLDQLDDVLDRLSRAPQG